MKSLFQQHYDITNEVKLTIEQQKVVFPAQYAKLYHEAASMHNVELSPDELLASEMLDERMVRHIITLAECTQRAVQAIETQDKTDLERVLLQTQELQEEIQELQKIIYEDNLTKSYNRKWFDDTILTHDNITLRENGTIVMVDLNKFKDINDTYGHIIGDKVLIHVAQKLKETGARVVRYGGDEFILIFDEKISLAQIEEKIETILHYFGKMHFKVEDHNFKTSFAYGLAAFKHGTDVANIIASADKAMYKNKKNRH
ncbi:MAG: GGDEF domain-containing protein [Sulfurimonas sp.]|nr:GGDEF domain-containing protein [Sulfurimonas sp.]